MSKNKVKLDKWDAMQLYCRAIHRFVVENKPTPDEYGMPEKERKRNKNKIFVLDEEMISENKVKYYTSTQLLENVWTKIVADTIHTEPPPGSADDFIKIPRCLRTKDPVIISRTTVDILDKYITMASKVEYRFPYRHFDRATLEVAEIVQVDHFRGTNWHLYYAEKRGVVKGVVRGLLSFKAHNAIELSILKSEKNTTEEYLGVYKYTNDQQVIAAELKSLSTNTKKEGSPYDKALQIMMYPGQNAPERITVTLGVYFICLKQLYAGSLLIEPVSTTETDIASRFFEPGDTAVGGHIWDFFDTYQNTVAVPGDVISYDQLAKKIKEKKQKQRPPGQVL